MISVIILLFRIYLDASLSTTSFLVVFSPLSTLIFSSFSQLYYFIMTKEVIFQTLRSSLHLCGSNQLDIRLIEPNVRLMATSAPGKPLTSVYIYKAVRSTWIVKGGRYCGRGFITTEDCCPSH